MCSTFNIQCSWDGLLGERNCSCVWSFWCSELCSIDQTVTVQRGSVLDLRGPEWFYQPFCSLWINSSWRVGRVVPMIHSAVRTAIATAIFYMFYILTNESSWLWITFSLKITKWSTLLFFIYFVLFLIFTSHLATQDIQNRGFFFLPSLINPIKIWKWFYMITFCYTA